VLLTGYYANGGAEALHDPTSPDVDGLDVLRTEAGMGWTHVSFLLPHTTYVDLKNGTAKYFAEASRVGMHVVTCASSSRRRTGRRCKASRRWSRRSPRWA
jgi:hypothetical protein